jgi:Na+-transporting methylmalonyl-CoA/oxaloacetate decarboxylase gamma subunit
MAFNITKIGGVYSLIVSPNSSRLRCGFRCWYKTHKALFWWIIGALILLIILLLLILIIWIMCRKKAPAEKPAKTNLVTQERTTTKSSFIENTKTTTEQS